MDTKNIADIYKQTPLQQGMLFHTLYDPEAAVYFEQNQRRLHQLNRAAYKEAWQRVVQRHTALRTAFHWEDLEEPLQVVYRQVEMPIEEMDWRHLDKETQQQQLAELCAADRRRGFDLTAAPVMRLILIRLDETTMHQIWDAHHMVLDGLSAFVVTREVMEIYDALCEERPFTLPQPRPFRDYVQWLNQVDLDQAKTYWQTQLASFAHATTLTIDQDPAQVNQPDAAQGEQLLDFPPDFVQSLQPFLRQHRITFNTLIQAAWGLLLSVYSGNEDVLFGQTNHGRPVELSGFADMVGLFITTTPVRITIPARITVAAWLQQVQTAAIAQRRFEHTPLTQIQSWSDIPHGEPLFHTLLLVQSNPAFTAVQDEGSERYEKTNYPIALSVLTNEKDYLRVVFKYNESRFSETAVTQLLTHFRHLMQTLCAAPDQPVAHIPLLPPNEHTKMTTAWNQTAVDFDLSQTVPALVHQQAVRTPGETAVAFADTHLTYQELDQRSNQLARYLQAAGVTAETVVGVCVERSPEMVVSLLAVLKAGGAYIPIDPGFPVNRINMMLTDSGAPILLTQTALVAQMGFAADRLICIDAEWSQIDEESDAFLSDAVPQQLAYIIYTSGSTGKPKGVQITHQALTNFLFAMQEKLHLTPADKLLAVTTISFDIAGLELYLPLLTGAQIQLADRETAGDGVALLNALQDCTIMQATPATWRMLPTAGWDSSPHLTILCGGEALSHDLAAQLVTRGKQVWNMYGPTETTIWSTMQAISAETLPDLVVGELITIGRPIANTELYIVDKHLRPVPVGVPGELLIGGAGVARGYFQRPDLTAEKFIAHPFAENGVLYCTGDLAAYLADGSVAFYGRIDHQVKVRGYRIELGEIEAALNRHPDVHASVLTARENAPGDKRLVAYIKTNSQLLPTAHTLREFLHQTLPAYMIPSTFVRLHDFPLTPNGKIDRQALPMPEKMQPVLGTSFTAPRNTLEANLAAIWQDVLHVETVGIHDNFFELGGDSLLCIRIIAKAKKMGLHFTPKQLLSHQTIAQLMTIDAMPAAETKQESLAGPIPLTTNQAWFFNQDTPNRNHWNMPGVLLDMASGLHIDNLKLAIRHILTYHDALRTRFTRSENGWRAALVVPDESVPFTHVDLSDIRDTEREIITTQTVNRLHQSLNITQGPTLQIALLDFGPDRGSKLFVTAHHLVTDASSFLILLEDLQTAYTQLSRNQNIQLPAKTTSIKTFAECWYAYAQSAAVRQEAEYWLNLPWNYTPFPIDYPNAAAADNVEGSIDIVQVSLGQEETNVLLHKMPSVYHAQMLDVLLTALVQSITSQTGGTWLPVIMLDSGRIPLFDMDDMDLSRSVGLFAAGSFMILQQPDADDPIEKVMSIKEQVRQVPNRGVGFELLLRCSEDAGLKKQLQALRKADVKFNYLGRINAPPNLESAEIFTCPQMKRDEALYGQAFIINDRLYVNWWYSKHLHRRETIEGIGQQFIHALQSLVDHIAGVSRREHLKGN